MLWIRSRPDKKRPPVFGGRSSLHLLLPIWLQCSALEPTSNALRSIYSKTRSVWAWRGDAEHRHEVEYFTLPE